MYGGIIHEGAKKVKKSFVRALSTVCLFAAGAFFMGCSASVGDDGGSNPYIGTKAPGTALTVGDIIFNDGSATPYSVIDARTDKKCTDAEKAAAIAVIFRVGDGTEGNKTLGFGIKFSDRAWCKNNAQGYDFVFSTENESDGNKNLYTMAKELDEDTTKSNDTGLNKVGKNYVLPEKDETTGSDYLKLKTNYPAFEFAYYYGKNGGHNTVGSSYETGWYLPLKQELKEIFDANSNNNSVIDNSLGAAGGNKFGGHWFWSSSQWNHSGYENYAWGFSCQQGNLTASDKDDYDYGGSSTGAIRAFN